MQPFMRTTWLEEQVQDVARMAQALRATGITSAENLSAQLDTRPEIAALVDEHVRTFAWYGSHHWEGEGYSRDKVLVDLARLITASAPARVANATVQPHNDGHAGLWHFIALCAYWRTHCAEVADKVLFYARPGVSSLAARFGMTYDELLWLLPSELKAAMHVGTRMKPADLDVRKSGYGYYLDEQGEHVIVGSELAEMIRVLVTFEKIDDVTEFKGTVASKGSIVRGLAKVILGPRDFVKFKEGDILVVPETTPDFVPLMKMASAIVTEVGGITSHAAIVSRELKKPCIIGTKVATRILKDGDTIEVDTASGTIRRITGNS